ncbi:MAG: hypothetical protein IJ989_01170 [Paludibacteraceae bacterium]|nr:hypothetical protein [Paludibacteraceae bacterium]
MKKLALFAVALLASAVSFAALNPYAYGLSSALSADETKLTVNYSLNATATAVSVVILDGETVVKTVDCADKGLTPGAYTVEIPTTDFPKTKSLTWKVEVKGESVATPTIQDTKFNFYLPYGLDCDVDPESDYLGNWYVIEANTHSKVGYVSSDTQRGLYAFDATLTGIKNKNGTYGFTGGMTVTAAETNMTTTYVNLYRTATSGGRIFVGRFRSGYAPVLEATDLDSGDYPLVLKSAQGRAVAIDVRGQGENLELMMLTTDFQLKRYDLGTATDATAASKTTDLSQYIIRDDASMVYDADGGVWINQHRGGTDKPTIVHVSSEGVVDYDNLTAGISHLGCNNSGIAINPAGTELAVVGAGTKTLTIYSVSKDAEGKIALTKKYTISTAGNNHTALSYDYAGNLYVANRSAETITFYAMPYSGMVATPAPSKYAFQLQDKVQGTFYTLTTNVDATMGQVTGNDGQYLEGTKATITAVANRGHKFLNWTVGEETKTENPLTLIINSDLTVTANFEALPAYTITATANDAAMGSVTGAGTYYEGEEVTLKATANAGHAFVDWSNGAIETTLTFAATKDSTVQANFKVLSYTVALATNDEAKGSVAGAGTYDYGTEVELTATPAEGYELLYWSDRSTENPRTITVNGNKALSAYFVKEYTQEPAFTIEKLWENAQVPAATGDGYQAVGWDGKIYMQNKTVGKIQVFSNGTDAAVDYATSGTGQQIAIDEAGNLIVFNAYFATATPNAVLIYQKGSTEGKAISFTLPNPGRCDFFSASGNIYSAEGGYVYFYCSGHKVVNRLKITNGAATATDVTVDAVGNTTYAANSTSHVMVDIFGNLVAHCRSNAVDAIDVLTNETKTFTLPSIKMGTLGGCSFELGGKELWAYHAGATNYSSEWNIYNMTDKKFLSDEVLYAVDKANSTNNACNWLNVQKVDEKTAYIYQFCPKKGVAVWKVTCDTGEEPENPTALDNTVVAPQVQKIVRDGQVLIIRDGKTFNMMGQEVR